MTSIKFPGRALAVAAAVLAPLACHASDGIVTINGAVRDETCTINGAGSGSSTFTVTLPTVSKAALTGTGNGVSAGLTQFAIALTGCTAVISGSVSAYFEPDPAKVNAATGRLKNTGTATNIEVELLNNNLTVMDLSKNSGSQNSTSQSVTTVVPSATLTYYAQYRAVGAATAGSVNTSVTYTITYP